MSGKAAPCPARPGPERSPRPAPRSGRDWKTRCPHRPLVWMSQNAGAAQGPKGHDCPDESESRRSDRQQSQIRSIPRSRGFEQQSPSGAALIFVLQKGSELLCGTARAGQPSIVVQAVEWSSQPIRIRQISSNSAEGRRGRALPRIVRLHVCGLNWCINTYLARGTSRRSGRRGYSETGRRARFPAVLTMDNFTDILSAIEHGDPRRAEQLLPLVYDELRKLAAQQAGAGEAGADAPGYRPGA